MNQKLIEKIQKLLALAESPNENEARAAAEKANALLIEHNLSMQEVENAQFNYTNDTLHEGKSMMTEFKYIGSIIQKHFFCRVVVSRSRRERKTTLLIAGEKTNVEVAKYIWAFLNRTYKDLWDKHKKATGLGQSSRQAYFVGLSEGLSEQLTVQRKKIEDDRALVLKRNPELDKFMQKEFGRTGTYSTSSGRQDAEAQAAGREHGKAIQIRRGVTSTDGNKGRLLG